MRIHILAVGVHAQAMLISRGCRVRSRSIAGASFLLKVSAVHDLWHLTFDFVANSQPRDINVTVFYIFFFSNVFYKFGERNGTIGKTRGNSSKAWVRNLQAFIFEIVSFLASHSMRIYVCADTIKFNSTSLVFSAVKCHIPWGSYLWMRGLCPASLPMRRTKTYVRLSTSHCTLSWW